VVLSWEQMNQQLNRVADILNQEDPVSACGPFHMGIDLGTADVVLIILDQTGEPVAAFLEWAQVVRDGVVFDFIGAAEIVSGLVDKAQKRLGVELTTATTSYPPGTDPRISTNVLERAGLKVAAVDDEPRCVASLLQLDKAAIVDIGGGTTGTAVVQRGNIVFSDDEPTGGHHISLTLAGHFGISLEEAEKRKRRPNEDGILDLALPTIQRISDIVAGHIRNHLVERIVLTGGTCCLPGVDHIITQELSLPTLLPCQPLLLTPLSIAALSCQLDI